MIQAINVVANVRKFREVKFFLHVAISCNYAKFEIATRKEIRYREFLTLAKTLEQHPNLMAMEGQQEMRS